MKIPQKKQLVINAASICLALLFLSFLPKHQKAISLTEEICDNAIDDDLDGLIDLNDPDCECEFIEPISLIPNPSFEDLNCCPDDRSQLNCADNWVQASQPTTDLLHLCGWLGWDDFPPPMPFPDGEGIMGFRDGRVRQNTPPEKNWKEYAGACLLSPLQTNVTYRFEFHVGFVNSMLSPPIEITFFGSENCENLPFGNGDAAFGCPTNGPGWKKLGATDVAGGFSNSWVQAFIEITPENNINAIVIGAPCEGVAVDYSVYYFFDNLVLADIESFQFQIEEVSHPCNENYLIEVPDNENFSYQWYKDGIGLIGETAPQITQMYGEGIYQVRLIDGISCRVSTGFLHEVPSFLEEVNRSICKDETYTFGDQTLSESGRYEETFTTINNCDSTVVLNLKVLGEIADSVNVKIFEGETYELDGMRFNREGDYLLNFLSAAACDSLVLLNLSFYNIYIPNVFSPNADGINDDFSVFGGPDLEAFNLKIFNRWGAQIYDGSHWDGKYKGEEVNPGVFTYIVSFMMNDGVVRQASGSVTVLK